MDHFTSETPKSEDESFIYYWWKRVNGCPFVDSCSVCMNFFKSKILEVQLWWSPWHKHWDKHLSDQLSVGCQAVSWLLLGNTPTPRQPMGWWWITRFQWIFFSGVSFKCAGEGVWRRQSLGRTRWRCWCVRLADLCSSACGGDVLGSDSLCHPAQIVWDDVTMTRAVG